MTHGRTTFKILDLLVAALPKGFEFGVSAMEPLPGGINSGTSSDPPLGWKDPPFADDVRMLLELARGHAARWNERPNEREQIVSYIDLAMSVLYGPINPNRAHPTSLPEVDSHHARLDAALKVIPELRKQHGG